MHAYKICIHWKPNVCAKIELMLVGRQSDDDDEFVTFPFSQFKVWRESHFHGVWKEFFLLTQLYTF